MYIYIYYKGCRFEISAGPSLRQKKALQCIRILHFPALFLTPLLHLPLHRCSSKPIFTNLTSVFKTVIIFSSLLLPGGTKVIFILSVPAKTEEGQHLISPLSLQTLAYGDNLLAFVQYGRSDNGIKSGGIAGSIRPL